MVHIADVTAEVVRARGLRRVGLLATRSVMEDDFYLDCLTTRSSHAVLVPATEQLAMVHRAIYAELCLGEIRDDSREACREMITGLAAAGAAGFILGRPELRLLIPDRHSPLPLLDRSACTKRPPCSERWPFDRATEGDGHPTKSSAALRSRAIAGEDGARCGACHNGRPT